ncbi:hypothetical protein SteCoe_11520 [Stentor coeruleus]|uniref:Protein kinase domain-containing protein n=1 Tax=Stentor coeruleus TaxID=5963 RepID=A0A1R2CCY2_9CILI|nr:hypothetical protein SteCoe_11520 [Stentor coeruleus]
MAATPETLLSVLSNIEITFQEVEAFYTSSIAINDVRVKLSCFLKSADSSRISFQAKAHLGFLFSHSPDRYADKDRDIADYIENAVFSDILLANHNDLEKISQLPMNWPNHPSKYTEEFSNYLDIRRFYQLPLVENINQVRYLEELKIDNGVVRVEIDFQSGTIPASATIRASDQKPAAREIIYYMQKGYPKFYGIITNIIIQDVSYRLTFFDRHKETLKQCISSFNVLSKKVKDERMKERQIFAFDYYHQLAIELNSYREFGLFHNCIRPNNILIYNNDQTSNVDKVFLFNGECIQFKLAYGVTEGILVNSEFDRKNKRYLAPEIAYKQEYCKKYSINENEFSYNVSDAWSLAACILNLLTDQNADKWNGLNFTESLNKIVNSLVKENDKLKEILLRSLENNMQSRLKFNEALVLF